MIGLKINGLPVSVEPGSTLLEAAQFLGFPIPTLCHMEGLSPYGACRLCVVEVTRGKWTWLTTACDLPIREGLYIRTETPQVQKARRTALELLWAEAPDAWHPAAIVAQARAQARHRRSRLRLIVLSGRGRRGLGLCGRSISPLFLG